MNTFLIVLFSVFLFFICVFLFFKMSSQYFLMKTFANDTTEEISDFIEGIKNKDHKALKYLLYFYALKKEGLIKRIVLIEVPGITFIIRAYSSKLEFFEYWNNEDSFPKINKCIKKDFNCKVVDLYYKDIGFVLEYDIDLIINKYVDYDSEDLLKHIIFLTENKILF